MRVAGKRRLPKSPDASIISTSTSPGTCPGVARQATSGAVALVAMALTCRYSKPWQRLNLVPLPQGQGSFRLTSLTSTGLEIDKRVPETEGTVPSGKLPILAQQL
jgi:hypothetical protein